jgi:hypothetical protein
MDMKYFILKAGPYGPIRKITILLMTIIVSPVAIAGAMTGSLKVSCLVAGGSTPRRHAPARVRLTLITEDTALIARLQIERTTETLRNVKLAAYLPSLQTVSFEDFKSYCGDTVVVDNTLGQSIEFMWILRKGASADRSTLLYQQEIDLAQVTPETIVTFATEVAQQLQGFAGQITGSSVNVRPADALDPVSCGGLMGCMTQVLHSTPKSLQVPLDLVTRELTPSMVKALQAGQSI